MSEERPEEEPNEDTDTEEAEGGDAGVPSEEIEDPAEGEAPSG